MASLRLTFPEKDEPTIIALTGARLTIGRLPFNTIQIIDRTVSGFHAELISEHGHYRLHDRGSSNGTFVNGQKVTDYHLAEACTLSFGTVEAQFNPEEVSASEDTESFPTRSEINAVRKENVELKSTVEALREEIAAFRQARPMENGSVALAVTKEEFDKVVIERELLKEERLKQDEDNARLKGDLAVLKRDRLNLQLAYDGLQREISDLRAKASGAEEVALLPKAAAVVLAAQAPAPGEEVRLEVPMVAASKEMAPPVEATSAPEEPPIPEEPPSAEVPAEAESIPVGAPAAKPPSVTPLSPKKISAPVPMKPFAPIPRGTAVAATAVPKPGESKPGVPVVVPKFVGAVKAPGLPSGLRPLGQPPAPAAPPPHAPLESGVAALPKAPTTRLAPRPLPTVKLPLHPSAKPSGTPPAVGPKGTQKLS